MFTDAQMMYFYVETPLHAGTGRALGSVDLPIQRERITGYPMVQSSSVKGKLRATADKKMSKDDVITVFGPDLETGNASDHSGALAPGDAKLLLFPVRSLHGVFAWATCATALQRFVRDFAMTQTTESGTQLDWKIPELALDDAAVVTASDLVANGEIVLEEFVFKASAVADVGTDVRKIGDWLAQYALPQTPAYANYWKATLPKRLVILHDDAFRDFTQFATEVQTHVKIDQDKKTVKDGALWTAEYLPVDTLLYAPLCATPSRNGTKLDGKGILKKVTDMKLSRLQLGGDETTGHGIVGVRM
jgi:CRISPR-associated protein Cmr4